MDSEREVSQSTASGWMVVWRLKWRTGEVLTSGNDGKAGWDGGRRLQGEEGAGRVGLCS